MIFSLRKVRATTGALAVAGLVLAAVSGCAGFSSAPPTPSPSSVQSTATHEASASASPSPSPSPTEAPLAWGPTQNQWQDALATARELPVAQAAGQTIVASYAGSSPQDIRSLIEEHHLGGVMLQGDATADKKTTSKLTAAAGSAHGGRDWPVMIAVDQEGGTVARLRTMIPDMPAFMAAGAATDKAVVREAYAHQGWFVRSMGFNTNFAPDTDVTVGLKDPIIRTRSAGSDPDNVSATVNAALDGYTSAGLISSVKHFPGHGSVDVDSHKELPVQSSSMASLEKRDLVPFASAIEAGTPSIMMGHISVPEWGKAPASLAPGAYSYLRDRMGFTGAIITDALNMGAIVNHYEPGEASVAALKAGADIVLLPPDVDAAVSHIVAAVESGELSRSRLDEAAARSILLMRWQDGLGPAAADAPPADFAQNFAAQSATVVTPTCGAPLVSGTVTVLGGLEGESGALALALADRGISAGDKKKPGTTVYLAGNSSSDVEADVVVAMAGPWVLERSKATTYVALYGRSDDAIRGLADVLVGDVTPQSTWPVALKGVAGKPC